MDCHLLVNKQINAELKQFWTAVRIWLTNPHLINKRISSSKIIFKAKINENYLELVIEDILKINNVTELINNNMNKNIDILNMNNVIPIAIETDLFIENEETGVFLIINNLLPRENDKYTETIEFTIVNKNNPSIISIHKQIDINKKSLSIRWPYKIIYDSKLQELSLTLSNIENDLNDPSIEWCKNKLFSSLIKWMESNANYNENKSLVKESLSLIPIDKYTQRYNDLKKKYGIELVEKWTECTDPKKFVYEDIAIASYLILLWELEREEKGIDKKQSFVDLGCGNGLLVYILTNEGHTGLGIDLRKRKIWDLFAGTTQLEEKVIIPSSNSLFPDTDWLIGNHSDELTPWIPVIAARSSYKCRFFLLPCCAHEFDGRKFQRDSASHSQYYQYLTYIKSVCETCGFNTKLDRLRIPSTKRICLIGWSRNYSEDQTRMQDEHIKEIINARSLALKMFKNNCNIDDKTWSHDFKPREAIAKVRNCTQIDKNIIQEIVNLVAHNLLRKVRIINSSDNNKKWNAGGNIELNEIATIIPSALLKQLKNECGGLQTLLRNNSHIFQVVNGLVLFRLPGTITSSERKRKRQKKSNLKLKIKPCWFFNNHPDGCLLTNEKCNFKHEK